MRDSSKPQARVLVAEDSALVSMFVADDLQEHGYQCVGPFARGSDALAKLATQTPDLAIVDWALQDGFCIELIRELRDRGVPLVIFSEPVPKRG
jgi:two-component system, response regulator PdtaR